jgi:hypothetical protein
VLFNGTLFVIGYRNVVWCLVPERYLVFGTGTLFGVWYRNVIWCLVPERCLVFGTGTLFGPTVSIYFMNIQIITNMVKNIFNKL